MKLFDLPKSTEYGRVIPKNAFDEYTNTQQRKLIAETIQRITWTNKLSKETTNLKSGSVKEIQVFQIELKQKNEIKKILDIFDRSIPYHIIFVLIYQNEILLSSSAKHDHVAKINESVLDCTFKTDWKCISLFDYEIELKESMDKTYTSFCCQISKREKEYGSYSDFVEQEVKIKSLESQIAKIVGYIKREKQYNKKVRLNMELSILKRKLSDVIK